MSARFIVRVDDVGQALVQKNLDVGLEQFRRWLAAWGEVDEPMYLGVVTGQLTDRELEMLFYIESHSQVVLCIHGHTHAPAALSPDEIVDSLRVLRGAKHFIAPYNQYNEETLAACWQKTPTWMTDPVFFGGFDGDHHSYGEAPCVVDGVLHLSAHNDLYAHSYRLVDMVEKMDDPGYPLVVTLHHRWDANALDGVTRLHEALRGRIVSTAEAWP